MKMIKPKTQYLLIVLLLILQLSCGKNELSNEARFIVKSNQIVDKVISFKTPLKATKGLCKENKEIELTNRLDSALELLSVRTSCGCTVADISPCIIAPGESYKFNIAYQPQGKAGKNVEDVYVKANSTGLNLINIKLEADEQPPLVMEPRSLQFVLSPNSTKIAAVSVKTLHAKELIKDVSITLSGVSASIGPDSVVTDGQTIDITCESGDAYGKDDGALLFYGTDSTYPLFRILVFRNVTKPFLPNVESVLLYPSNRTKVLKRTISFLQIYGSNSLKMKFVKAGHPSVQIQESRAENLTDGSSPENQTFNFDLLLNPIDESDSLDTYVLFTDGNTDYKIQVTVEYLNL